MTNAFAVLAEPMRATIVERLAERPMAVGELADEGRAVLLVTHNPAVSDAAVVVHRLDKGRFPRPAVETESPE